jgi:hypothetical protein
MAGQKKQRCWPGYEPVPGKPAHSQGSCRPKAEAKLTAAEKRFRTKRKRQLSEWQKSHPGSRRSAAQHLSAPDNPKAGATKKKAASRKTSRPRATKRPAATKTK